MKNTLTRTVIAAALASTLCAPVVAATEFNNEQQKESYAVGASMGKYLLGQLLTQQQLGVDHDLTMVIAGIEDALTEQTSIDQDTLLTLINARAELLNEKVTLKKAALAKENQQQGEAFLAENAKKAGVSVTASGLQYEVLVQGDGAKPLPEEVALVKYKGMTIDGAVFEDTTQLPEPAKVSLINVIDGWNEGIQLMNVGSTYRFTIPAKLAYGTEGMELIGPNSTLIFDIELVGTERPSMGMGMGMGMGMSGHH